MTLRPSELQASGSSSAASARRLSGTTSKQAPAKLQFKGRNPSVLGLVLWGRISARQNPGRGARCPEVWGVSCGSLTSSTPGLFRPQRLRLKGLGSLGVLLWAFGPGRPKRRALASGGGFGCGGALWGNRGGVRAKGFGAQGRLRGNKRETQGVQALGFVRLTSETQAPERLNSTILTLLPR